MLIGMIMGAFLVKFKHSGHFWVLELLLMLLFATCRDEIFAYYMMPLAH